MFYSVDGLGKGIWGLRSYHDNPPPSNDEQQTSRVTTTISRIIRDTNLSKEIKKLHNFRCQICGTTIDLGSSLYAEGHHIKPLGSPHNGPDVAENIIVLCPNHHVMCDNGIIKLDLNSLIIHKKHVLSSEYIEYHNKVICQHE